MREERKDVQNIALEREREREREMEIPMRMRREREKRSASMPEGMATIALISPCAPSA